MTGNTVGTATYLDYEPISLCPAPPGWRAAYVHEPRDGQPGWSAEPVVCFGIFQVTQRPCVGSLAREEDEGRSILAVVGDGEGWFCPAEEASNFWRLLAPGSSDPTVEEVASEQAWRARKAARPSAAAAGTPARAR